MATYKTPDVYVEEISLFPPSVAEVETAIPAFIGYTEKATKITTGDLSMIPTRIKSMLEFEKYYGGAPELSIDKVYIDDDGNYKSSVVENKFYMFDSLRLFYDNGGGDCYIVSVGDYEDSVTYGDELTGLVGGLTALEKYDEPTIILYPDAVKLTGTKMYDLQKLTLAQCNDLKDRVGVFDLMENDPNGDTFRSNVGINYLKYGMAYTPWLKVALDKNVSYDNIKDKIFRYGSASTTPLALTSFTTDAELVALVNDYNKMLADKETATDDIEATFTPQTTFRQRYDFLLNEYETDKSVTNLSNLIKFLYNTAGIVDDWANGFTNTVLQTTTAGYINTSLRGIYEGIVAYDLAAADGTNGIDTYTKIATAGSYTQAQLSNANWQTDSGDANTNIFKASAVDPDAAYLAELTDITDAAEPTETEDKMALFITKIKGIFEALNKTFNTVVTAISSQEDTFENSMLESFPLYKTIIQSIDDSSTTMPPSGAVVGVYAATDRNRGVWKAPANVSLTSVIGPGTIFTQSETDALNIDVNAGKSINAIRAFTGKGTLIWGARTLAGNDNEWRYIPVRRFFNMVEESIKKSTYWAVFEPNSGNTWVKVKGMIENYLTNKWREGALVGAKPDDAFFVKIGLGQTMTAQDILNGYMYVEIGMAVVRPAEFIVLKFSHKLQQS